MLGGRNDEQGRTHVWTMTAGHNSDGKIKQLETASSTLLMMAGKKFKARWKMEVIERSKLKG